MGAPLHNDKHDHPPVITAEALIEHRRRTGRDQGPVPPTVIVTWQPSLVSHVVGSGLEPIRGWNGTVFQLSPTLGFARFPVGAPVAAILTEELAATGATTLIGVGTAGALAPDLGVGDVVIGVAAARDEGTSHHYAPTDRYAEPDPELIELLRGALPDATCGSLWTTDCPYRETRHEIDSFRQEGVLAVEMEAAAMYVVARSRGIRAATVVSISDLLHGEEWEPHFRSEITAASQNQVFDRVRAALA